MVMTAVMARLRGKVKNEKGMTLIELLAVIVILGIIAGIASVVILNQFDTARTNSNAASGKIVRDAAQRYIVDNAATAEPEIDKPAGLTISSANLINGGYLQAGIKDGAGVEFTQVVVKRTTTGNVKTITFTITPASLN